jgi:hypothetical protein
MDPATYERRDLAMSVTWGQTVGILVGGVPGWGGVWSLVFVARGALSELAAIPGSDDDLALTYAGLDLTYALGEIEHLDPSAPGVAASLGPVSANGLGATARALDDLFRTARLLVQDLVVAIGFLEGAVATAGLAVRLAAQLRRSRVCDLAPSQASEPQDDPSGGR